MTLLLVLFMQSTVLLALGFAALFVTRRRGPAVQTLVGRAMLSSVALLLLLAPLVGHIKPVVRVEPTPVRSLPPLPKREGKEVWTRDVKMPSHAVKSAGASAAETASTEAGIAKPENAVSSAPTTTSKNSDPSRFGRGRYGVPGVGLLLWLALCQFQLVRLRRTAQAIVDGPATALLATLTPGPPLLLTHPAVTSPFLAGLRRPAIFLPPTYAADFDTDVLRAIFVHELAHLGRRDNLWTLAARLLTSVLWFQPLLWLLCRKLEHISEDACDQAVLASNCPPRAYAACLLSLAERPRLASSQRTLTAGVAPYRSSVGRRISRILTQGVLIMPPVTLRLRLIIAALTLAAALGGAFLVSSAPAQTTVPAPRVPTLQEQQFRAHQKQDLQNLKVIGLAIIQYTQDNDEFYPDAAHWMDELSPYLKDKTVFFDPFHPNALRYGYAFNRNCSGKALAAFAEPADTVSIFDSTLGTRNASDTGQSLALQPTQRSEESSLISNSGCGYGFTDGHVKWKEKADQPSFAVNWDRRFIQMRLAHPDASLPKVLYNPPVIMSQPYANQALLAAQRNFLATPAQPSPELNQARFLAGLTLVQGPGVVVTLTDSKKPLPGSLPPGFAPPDLIHDTDINQVVNELKAAGAEAISVNGQRLVATSAIRSAGPVVFVNNTPLGGPYIVQAIGNPKTLMAQTTMRGGFASQLKNFDPAMFSVIQSTELVISAYAGGRGEPRYAKPVGQ